MESSVKTAKTVSQQALDEARRMLGGLGGNTQLCGDSKVVDGCWVETHTLGCRNAADEPESEWEASHARIRDEYASDGVSTVLDDENSSNFATITPQTHKEASSYEEMFSGLIKALPSVYAELPNGVQHRKNQIKQEISWAKHYLRKQDRIIWWLRWWRLWLLASISGQDQNLIKTYLDPEVERMNRVTGRDTRSIANISDAMIGKIRESLLHYLGLPAEKIQEVIWDKQTPVELRNQFRALEEEWKQQTKKRLQPHEGDEIVMAFPDGWAWWLLGRGYCPEEAAAMGHCGNITGQYRTDERILSLRRPTQGGRWEPFLTFILDGNGELGEMKGRGNEKPADRYHKYIIPLLEDRSIVKGIKGGGYLPSHNFNLADLAPTEQKKVREANPSMVLATQRLRELDGVPDKELIERISKSEEVGHSTYDPKLNGWVNWSWDNPAKFIEHELHGIEREGYEIFTGTEKFDEGYETNQIIRRVVFAVPLEDLAFIEDYWVKQGTFPPDKTRELEKLRKEWNEGKDEEQRRQDFLSEVFGLHDYMPTRIKLWDAWKAGITPAMREAIGEELKENLKNTWSMTGYYLHFSEDFWNGRVTKYMPAYEAARRVDGFDHLEEDEDYDAEAGDEYQTNFSLRDAYEHWDVNAVHRALMAEFGQLELPLRQSSLASSLLMKDASFEIIAANYEEMFASLLALVPEDRKQEVSKEVTEQIGWAKRTLKKQDRIVWWLRWYRLTAAANLAAWYTRMLRKAEDRAKTELQKSWPSKEWTRAEIEEQDRADAKEIGKSPEVQQLTQTIDALTNYRNKEAQALSARTGQPVHSGEALDWFSRNQRTLQHYLSLPVPGIQNEVWDKQTPQGLLRSFSAKEREWQDRTRGLLQPHTKPETNWKQDREEQIEDAEIGLHRLTRELEMLQMHAKTGWMRWEKRDADGNLVATGTVGGGHDKQYKETGYVKHKLSPKEVQQEIAETGDHETDNQMWKGVNGNPAPEPVNPHADEEKEAKHAAKEPAAPVYFHIEVPRSARDHFWVEPPAGNLEFWAFKDRPRCFYNQKIVFTFDRKPVAEAKVLKIEDPGLSKCEQTGKFEKHYKVFWNPEEFVKYKTAIRTHRRPANRAYLDLCIWLAEHHPDWEIPKVEAEATLIRMGAKPDPRMPEKTAARNDALLAHGGWLAPDGTHHPMEGPQPGQNLQQQQEHADLAEELGYGSNQAAREAGYVRVVRLPRRALGLEADKLSPAVRRNIIRLLADLPQGKIVLEWHSPKDGHEVFANAEEGIDWLENRKIASKRITDESLKEHFGVAESLPEDSTIMLRDGSLLGHEKVNNDGFGWEHSMYAEPYGIGFRTFWAETNAVLLRYSFEEHGSSLYVTLPQAGPTQDQVRALVALVRREQPGYLAIEKAVDGVTDQLGVFDYTPTPAALAATLRGQQPVMAGKRPRPEPMPGTLLDDGWVTPDGKWIDASYIDHETIAVSLGFRGREPSREAINAGYVRVVVDTDSGVAYMMFGSPAETMKRAGEIIRHLPPQTRIVGIESSLGKYAEMDLAEAEEKFPSGSLRSVAASSQITKESLKALHDRIYDLPIRRQWLRTTVNADPLLSRKAFKRMKPLLAELVAGFGELAAFSKIPKQAEPYLENAHGAMLRAEGAAQEGDFERALMGLDEVLNSIHIGLHLSEAYPSELRPSQKVMRFGSLDRALSMFPNLGGEVPRAGIPPEEGQYAAVRTMDGQVFADKDWQSSTHVRFIQKAGIPPDKVEDGGWLINGVYEPTGRSDAEKYGERARAMLSTLRARAKESPEVAEELEELGIPSKTASYEGTARELATNGGWITPRGKCIVLDDPEDDHGAAAARWGLGKPNPAAGDEADTYAEIEAKEKGCIRVDWDYDLSLEMQSLQASRDVLLRIMRQMVPLEDTNIFIEWWVPSNKTQSFDDIEQAIEWLESL